MGESALAVIRVSGPAALAVASGLIRARIPLADFDSHRLSRATLVDPCSGDVLDEALCAVMRAPHSYTGEDTVEISCHGSPALARLVLERLVAQGARLAEPGEFTRRAFINGRLDLAQAEAVALLIGARTERAVALAARSVAGELSRRVGALRQSLIEALARLEVALDFPEDVGAPDTLEIHHIINGLEEDACALVAAARRGLVTHTGVTVAIVGAPNAGKSSLFNALLGRERAIVTSEAGTTRDVLEATISLAGVPVRLLDTAGIGTPTDAIDAEAMRRAQQAIEESDLLLVVVDGHRPRARDAPDIGDRRRLVVLSKSDLGQHPSVETIPGAVAASSKSEGGLDALLVRLVREVRLLGGGDFDGSAVAASLRQVRLLGEIETSLRAAGSALETQPMEIALIELRSALEATGALLGVATGEAVLDAIFARFCVGK